MRQIQNLCDPRRDVAAAGLPKTWIDVSETRAWFLSGILRPPDIR